MLMPLRALSKLHCNATRRRVDIVCVR
jgi:hypothetical protein